MRILIVDDEKMAKEDLVQTVELLEPDAEIASFDSSEEALEYCEKEKTDVAFLDIEMPGIDGLALADKIVKLQPKVNIIFVTAYSEYSLDAHDIYSSGYLLKPADTKSVRRALDHLRYPVEEDKKIQIHCFGKFEAFYNGLPVQFRYNKTKELLAYLINVEGAACTNGELLGILWEDKAVSESVKSNLRNLIADLRETLSSLGFSDAVVKSRNSIALCKDAFSCDYYDYLEGKESAIGKFSGEYMEQYSWAETNMIKNIQTKMDR